MAYFGECPQQNKLKKGRASQQTITKMILYKIQNTVYNNYFDDPVLRNSWMWCSCLHGLTSVSPWQQPVINQNLRGFHTPPC